VVEALERADQRPGPGGEHHGPADFGRRRRREPGQERHPLPESSLEIQLAPHGGVGHPGHLGALAGMFGQEFDHLGLDQGGVDVHDHEALPPAMEPGRLHGDVEAPDGGFSGQLAAEPAGSSAPETSSSSVVTGQRDSR